MKPFFYQHQASLSSNLATLPNSEQQQPQQQVSASEPTARHLRSNSNARSSAQAVATISTTSTNGHLNSMIEEFNREYSLTRENTPDNPQLDNSLVNSLSAETRHRCHLHFYKSTDLGTQLRRKQLLLEKAHDIINHVRTDMQVDKVAQAITQRQITRSTTPNATANNNHNIIRQPAKININDNLNYSALPPSSSQVFNPINQWSNNNTNTLKQSHERLQQQQYPQHSMSLPALCMNCQYKSMPSHSDDLKRLIVELQEKLCESNKSLHENIVELDEARTQIRVFQDKQLQQNETVETYCKQYENMKEKLKIALQKLKESKDREDSLLAGGKMQITQQNNQHYQLLQQQLNEQTLRLAGMTKQNEELQQRLSQTIQHNDELFASYSNILKVNAELQAKVVDQEEDHVKAVSHLAELRGQGGLLRVTESKVDAIEMKLSRIEEKRTQQQQLFKESQKGIVQSSCLNDGLKYGQPEKDDDNNNNNNNNSNAINTQIISYCIDLLTGELRNTFSRLSKIADSSDQSQQHQSLQPPSFDGVSFIELQSASEVAKSTELRQLIAKMDVAPLVAGIISKVSSIAVSLAEETIINVMTPLLQAIDRKILLIETILPRIKQGMMVIKQNQGNDQAIKGKQINPIIDGDIVDEQQQQQQEIYSVTLANVMQPPTSNTSKNSNSYSDSFTGRSNNRNGNVTNVLLKAQEAGEQQQQQQQQQQQLQYFALNTFAPQRNNLEEDLRNNGMTNRQSLSFKKQQFQEFDYFAGADNNNNNNNDNNNSQEKSNSHEDNYNSNNMQLDDVLADNSNNDTPKRQKEQENINFKFASVVTDGIKQIEVQVREVQAMQDKLEQFYDRVSRNQVMDEAMKTDFYSQNERIETFLSILQQSQLFIKKELGVVKAEIDYQLKIQRQMDLPKRYSALHH